MTEMKKAIDLMQGMYDITFVYDSSLVTAKPQAFPSAGNSLKENLERIFGGTGIKWEIRDEIRPAVPSEQLYLFWICV